MLYYIPYAKVAKAVGLYTVQQSLLISMEMRERDINHFWILTCFMYVLFASHLVGYAVFD
jgi:hypothetical protein